MIEPQPLQVQSGAVFVSTNKPRKRVRFTAGNRYNSSLRWTFWKVMETYLEVCSTMGSASVIDYTHTLEGDGPQYKAFSGGCFALVLWKADIDVALAATLSPTEHDSFIRPIFNGQQNFSVQSTEFLRVQERCAREFIRRGLQSFGAYFDSCSRINLTSAGRKKRDKGAQ